MARGRVRRRRDAGRRARRRCGRRRRRRRRAIRAEQIEAGRTRFAAQCGFCHGRDAAGGEGGTDLTRSTLVAEDVRGDKIGPLVRSGPRRQGDAGLHAVATPISTAIVAFIHDQKTQAATATGGRRAVDVADLQTGNADGGEALLRRRLRALPFGRPAISPASPRGYRGSPLLQRMLYPGRPGAAPSPRRAARSTVTLRVGPGGHRHGWPIATSSRSR